MKNNKMIKILTVLLFGVLIATGCSCTNSMCSDTDIANIKAQIELNNIDDWRNEFSREEGKEVYPAEFNEYYQNGGFEGNKTKAQVAKELEAQNPNVNFTIHEVNYV